MRITTKGRYALRAMIQLVQSSEQKPLSIKKITEKEDLSPIFLEQIFTKLKKSNLIISIRGAGGGFLLAKDPSLITVKDILEAVEEGICLTPCCTDETIPADKCNLIDDCPSCAFWNEANQYFMQYFDSYTLKRVVDEFDIQDSKAV